MSRILSRLQNLLLSQIMVIFLVGSMFFGLQSFNYGQAMLVADTVKTPEGIYYKGTPDNERAVRGDDRRIEDNQRKLKDTVNNVREKLNLNEETPDSTKEFFDSVRNKAEKRVEPITGSKGGYYKENPPRKDTADYDIRR